MDQNKKTPQAPVTDKAAPEVSKPKSVLELLEEDDEFEVSVVCSVICSVMFFIEVFFSQEFEGATWESVVNQTEEGQLWQDDWEDEDAKDDFTDQLRAQIQVKSQSS
jgi:hypothetical protein